MTDPNRGSVYLDANAFIFYAEQHPVLALRLKDLFMAVAAGRASIVTSELTIAEVFVGPLKTGRVDLLRTYEEILARRRGFDCVPITLDVLKRSAELRATQTLKLPDAIHVATALETRCSSFVTEDRRIQAPPPLRRQIISEWTS